MPFNGETLWSRFLFVQSASRQFVNPVAAMTMEMMVMAFPCPFIQRAEQGVTDLGNVPFFHQQFKRPIDGGQVERIHHDSATGKDLLDPQRPVLFVDDLLNG